MTTINWKKLIPHVVAVILFVLVAVIYCQPVLQGKVASESDLTHWKAMVQQMQKYKDTHGTFPLWTNSAFSGMPAYQIALDGHNPVPMFVFHDLTILFLPKPIAFFFLLCISFYFLAQVLRINPWISIVTALAYGYASFSAILVTAGHETEIEAMGYLPFLLGSIILLFEGKYWWGTALTALFSFQLVAMNHLQIGYYFALMAAFMTIAYAYQWIKAKKYKHLVIAGTLVVIAGGIGVISNFNMLLPTFDYSHETLRNGGLTLDTATNKLEKSKGLDKDYAFAWSYGPAETFTFVVPNIYGGSSFVPLPQDGKLADAIGEKNLQPQMAQQLFMAFTPYWGPQDGATGGPVYLGAVMTLLFIFSVIYVRSKHKWWLLAITVFAVFLAWGRHFAVFNDFMFDHFPLYNKFRSPTMSLVIPQLTFPIMVALCLQQLFFGSDDKAYIMDRFKKTMIVAGVLVLVLGAFYIGFDYHGVRDKQIQDYLTQAAKGDPSLGRSIANGAAADRQSLYGSDLVRSILYILIAAGILFLFIKGKIKSMLALAGLGLLSFIDLITVDTRYLNYDNYQEPEESTAIFNPTPADQQIMRDTSYYRVLNTTRDWPQDAITSYFHNSIGGYHAAKLALYQDLLVHQLEKEPINIGVLNMLNTKYIIVQNRQNGQPEAEANPGALGPCWLVKSIQYVSDPAAAMKALDHFNPADTAVVENAYQSEIPNAPQHDSIAYIHLIKNDNDVITYESASRGNEFAVFSEIYYNRGWKAYVDEKELPIVKVDYLLRGLDLPPGTHHIRFEFKPTSVSTGERLTDIGSVLIVLLLLGAIVQEYRRKKKPAAGNAA